MAVLINKKFAAVRDKLEYQYGPIDGNALYGNLSGGIVEHHVPIEHYKFNCVVLPLESWFSDVQKAK